MTRTTINTVGTVTVLVFVTGCQSLYRARSAPPPGIDGRLATIEQARLGLCHSSNDGSSTCEGTCEGATGGLSAYEGATGGLSASEHAQPSRPWRTGGTSLLNSGRALSDNAPMTDFAQIAAASHGGRLAVYANRPASAHSSNTVSAHRGDRGLGQTFAFDTPAQGWALTDIGDDAFNEEAQPDLEFSASSTDREEGRVSRPPLDSFWETVKRDVKDMPGDLWRDTQRVYANPVNLVILGTAYGGCLALQETGPDDTVEDRYRHGHHTFKEDWRDAFGAAGNPGTHFALAGLWYLIGQQRADEKTYEVGKTMFSALIISSLTTTIGQAASWDRAPNGEWGTFPSGHTSSSFCMASVLHEAYGHAVGIPLYGLATLVAMERIDSNEHYFSDVMMGAVVGTMIGHSVASGRDPEFFGWKVLPYASPNGGTGVALMKTMP
ncbi:MAG: phosphatase PAP2 family protein [Phycisphaerae bacterium]|nr:phosphatase PAP2 family protein [Phycisphaerae bacterium]